MKLLILSCLLFATSNATLVNTTPFNLTCSTGILDTQSFLFLVRLCVRTIFFPLLEISLSESNSLSTHPLWQINRGMKMSYALWLFSSRIFVRPLETKHTTLGNSLSFVKDKTRLPLGQFQSFCDDLMSSSGGYQLPP